MSFTDPFDEIALGSAHVRRRDLRQAETRRSSRTARRRGGERRRATVQQTGPGPRRPSRPPRKPLGRRLAAKLFSLVALTLAAAFAVATSVSPLLFSTVSATASVSHSAASSTIDGQRLSASNGAEISVARDPFQALSEQELNVLNGTFGVIDYTVNNSGPIRWPISSAVPLGDRFGPRAAPCPGCSTFHNGTDFETGGGAPVYAVADGVVTVSEFSGSLGQHVAIDHDVNGVTFTSIYGHLKARSSEVTVGEVVTEGQVIGLTGSTGESTGPHLDFEIDVNGIPIDSFTWLKAHTAH